MAADGRNLSQEVDDLKAMLEAVTRENTEMKRMLAEALSKNKDSDGASHHSLHVNRSQYPPGYESHNEEEDNGWGPKWNVHDARGNENEYRDWERAKLKEELEEKMQEQFRALRGPNPYGPMGIKELCLAPNVVFPKDFKMPELVKFDGSTNPLMHLKMYCTKMGMWSQDENFLISLFSESLDGAAWEWYMQLDRTQIRSWEDLAMAFTSQYKFNLNAAPTRDQLKGMKKKGDESFKEYAQRWRALAARVIPPMLESEMCSYFIRTLDGPFFKNMLGTHVKEFVDLVEIGERIEANIQEGKVKSSDSIEAQSRKGQFPKKKEGTINFIQPSTSAQRPQYTFQPRYTPSYPYLPPQAQPPYIPQQHNIPRPYTPNQPRPRQTYQFPNQQAFRPLTPAQPSNPVNFRPPANSRPLPNFNMTNSKLFRCLAKENMLSPRPGKAVTPPYPRWYDANVTCEYHSDTPGHSIEDCYAFRMVVWRLLDDKVIDVQQEFSPSIKNNPLPRYGDRQANALEEDSHSEMRLEDMHVSMKDIVKGLEVAGYEIVWGGERKRVLEEDIGAVPCMCEEGEGEHDIEACPNFNMFIQKLFKLGILQGPKTSGSKEKGVNMVRSAPLIFKVSAQKPTVVCRMPSPFPYQSDDAVPWVYETVVESADELRPDPTEAKVLSNIVGVGGMTRSGRIYQPRDSGKAVKESPTENPAEHKPEEEEGEFLKIMKQSEYDVVEQLKKTPAKISLFSLIMTSEAHRNALKRVLDQSFVHKDITPEKMEHIVNAIKGNDTITFTQKEVAPSSFTRPRALHITLKCQGYIIAKVLIDGGSALNVLPYSTLQQLHVDPAAIEPNSMIVRAFDGTKRGIMGNISLQLEVGPSIFTTEFQVMDIEPAYTMLLGRPWIHEAGAIPSTLHQNVKYIAEGKLITINGEEEVLLSKPVNVPYVDNAEQSLEAAFQSFEVIGAENTDDEGDSVVARMMYKKGYQKGRGLGIRLQGIKDPISLPCNTRRFGLGYEVADKESSGRSVGVKIPHVKKTFVIPVRDVHALEDSEQMQLLICPADDDVLNNWESESLPDLMYSE